MWFVLNYIPAPGARRSLLKSLVDAFNSTAPEPLEVFAPTFLALSSRDGKVLKTEKPLLYHYIFMRGPEELVKRFCLTFHGFSFVMDRSGRRRHLAVDDHTLEQFRIVAQYYGNKLPCFPLDGISLEEGDRVQIVSGPCTGLEGTYISRKGGKSGNILVAVDTSLAVVVYDVRAEYVRVLEFARDSRRVYDQLDAFALRLLSYLNVRRLEPDAKPQLADVAASNIFTTRLSSVKIDNPKLDAKLRILLFAAYSIIGDQAGAEASIEKYRRLSRHITNAWTRALALALLTAFDSPADSQRLLAEAAQAIQPHLDGRLSKVQQSIAALLS